MKPGEFSHVITKEIEEVDTEHTDSESDIVS